MINLYYFLVQRFQMYFLQNIYLKLLGDVTIRDVDGDDVHIDSDGRVDGAADNGNDPDVDAVANATVTSKAIMKAILLTPSIMPDSTANMPA